MITAQYVLIANSCYQEFRAKAYCLSQVLAGLFRFIVCFSFSFSHSHFLIFSFSFSSNMCRDLLSFPCSIPGVLPSLVLSLSTTDLVCTFWLFSPSSASSWRSDCLLRSMERRALSLMWWSSVWKTEERRRRELRLKSELPSRSRSRCRTTYRPLSWRSIKECV